MILYYYKHDIVFMGLRWPLADVGHIGSLSLPLLICAQVLAEFKSGRALLMCATDVAARGLDIPGIEVVVSTPNIRLRSRFLLKYTPNRSFVLYTIVAEGDSMTVSTPGVLVRER